MILNSRLRTSKKRYIRLISFLIISLFFFNFVIADEITDIKIIRGLVKDGAFNVARDKIESFIEKYHNSRNIVDVYSYYFDTLMALRDYGKLHSISDFFLSNYCKNEQSKVCFKALLFNAYGYFFENDYKQADRFLKLIESNFKSFKTIPDDLKCQYYLLKGDLNFKRDNFKEAIDNYNSYLKLKFDNKVRLKLAISYYHYKRFSKAGKILRKLEKEGYRNPLLNRYLGLVLYGKKKYREAYSYFVRNHDREDGFFAVYSLLKMNRSEDAYTLFRKLVPLPEITDAERVNFTIKTLLLKGDLLNSKKVVEKNNFIEDKEFYHLAFNVYDALRDYANAVKYLRKYTLIQDSHSGYFHLAEYYLTRVNDLNNALLFYNKCIEKNPEGPFSSIALLNRIKCTLYRGDREKALNMLADFLKKYGNTSPVTDDAYFVYGKLMLDMGNYREAAKSFENIVINYPDSSLVRKSLYFLGDSYFRLGMYNDTIEVFRNKNIKNGKAGILIALSYYLTGNYKEAIKYFKGMTLNGYYRNLYALSLARAGGLKDALKIAGDHTELKYFCYAFSGNKEQSYNLSLKSENPLLIYLSAIEQSDEGKKKLFLKKVLEFSSRASVVRKMALIELEPIVEKTKDYTIVMENESEFVKNNPEDFHGVQGFLKKAEKYRLKGNVQKAVYFYKMAIENYPDAKGVDRAYYFLFETLKNPPVTYLEKIVNTFPDSEYFALSCYKLGLIAFKNSEYKKAITYFSRVIARRDKNTDRLLFAVRYYLGVCYEKLGQTRKAIENYTEYLKLLPPDSKQVEERIRIALFLQKNGKVSEALREFKRILPLLKDDDSKAEVTFYIAECYRSSGDLKKALENFLSVTYLHPKEIMWSTTARFNAAKICEQLGYYDDAIKLYKKIADSFKGQVQGEYARKKLKELESRKK